MFRATAFFGGAWRSAGSALSSSLPQHAAAFSAAVAHAPEVAPSLLYWPLRLLRLGGIGVAVAALAIPVGTVGALVFTGRDDADAAELLHAVPRTLRVVWWSLWAAYQYKKLAASFAASTITEETYSERLVALHRLAAARLLYLCQRNGGVYVKAGQLAMNVQALPAEYREGLVGLEDRMPPHAFADINRVLMAELGAPAAVAFADFEPDATAAASLAQVHRAVTKTGAQVAVKIQYPGLESAVAADLTTMSALASLAYFFFPSSDWRWLFAELRGKLAQELDFRLEAAHASRLAGCFAHRRDVAVPRLLPELSTRRVLTMEWVEGAKISDIGALRRLGLAPRQVGLTLLDAAAEMMCVHGYVHGDMHPGNVFVRAQPRRGPAFLRLLPWCRNPRPQIVLLDHGLYFELDPALRQLYCMLWCAFVLNDQQTAADAAVQLAGPRAGKVLPEVLRPRDWNKLPPEERRRLRQEAGVGGIGDLTRLLSEAPRQLVDCLRAIAMVRHTASRLGVTVADRMRVNAVNALNGLAVEAVDARGRRHVEYVGVMQSRVKRWRLWLHIAAMRVVVWAALLLGSGVEPEAVVVATGNTSN